MTDSQNRSRPARRSTLSSMRATLRPTGTGGRRGRPSRGRHWRELSGLIVVVAVALVVSASWFIRARRQAAATRPPERHADVVELPPSPDIIWDEKWPRLVVTGIPARPLEEIRAAYAFAARRPDVLQSLPCYCGCKRQGHAGNEACYVTSRTVNGMPRWTDHAVTCAICVDITYEAIAHDCGAPTD